MSLRIEQASLSFSRKDPTKEIPWIESIQAVCKHYKKKSNSTLITILLRQILIPRCYLL